MSYIKTKVRSLPNTLSLIRLFFSPWVFLLAFIEEERLSAVLFFVLALTDALDGFLARLLKSETKLGKFLDPLADKFLLFFGLLTLTITTEYKASFLLLKTLIVRDLVLIGGSLFLKKFGFVPEPSFWGKLTTLFLSITVCVGFALELFKINSLIELFDILQFLCGILILVSGIDYVIKGAVFLKEKLIMEKDERSFR